MGQTLLVVRGWGGTPVERSSSCLLGRDTGEQGGCRGLQGGCRAPPANTTSPCWAGLCSFGAVLSGTPRSIPLHPEDPAALLGLLGLCTGRDPVSSQGPLHSCSPRTGALGHAQVMFWGTHR